MKQKVVLLILFIVLDSMGCMQAQRYEKRWKEMEASFEKALPQSALKQAEAIYTLAEKERNIAQMMKAYLAMMDCREEITPDSFYVDVKKLEKWVMRTTDKTEKAMLHFILADLLKQQVGGRYDYRQEETVEGYPEDMREWTSLHYARRAVDHYRLALGDIDRLGHVSMELFEPLWQKGNTGDYFQNDLLHIIGREVINALTKELTVLDELGRTSDIFLESNSWNLPDFLETTFKQKNPYDRMAFLWQIYQKMEDFYLRQGNRAALVLLDGKRLEQMKFFEPAVNRDEELGKKYVDGLQYLLDTYSDVDVCVEVYRAQACWLRIKDRRVEAMRCLEEGIARYPKYRRINVLKNEMQLLLAADCSVRFPKQLYPNDSIRLSVYHRNVTGLTLRVYRVDVPIDSIKEACFEQEKFRRKHTKLEATHQLQLKPTLDYLPADTMLQIKGMPEGLYLIEARGNHRNAVATYELVYVSAFKVIEIALPGKQHELVVVDFKTGHPVEEAELIGYRLERGGLESVWKKKADAEGKVLIEGNLFNAVRAIKGKDVSMPVAYGYGYSYYEQESSKKVEEHIQLFTDRSIYRPGQTVHVAGLIYNKQGDCTKVCVNKEICIDLMDANGEKVDSKKVKSNAYGSFTVDFMLPVACLTGYFRLETEKSRIGFQVEAYKRPSFEVTFEPVNGSYQIGDTVEVCGRVKTFSGLAVQQVEVAFSVSRSTPWWWRRGTQEMLVSGEVRTDEKGAFRIPVVLEACPEDRNCQLWYRNFQVEAKVTDSAGETQLAQTNLPVGSTFCRIDTDMPETLLKEKVQPFAIHVKNLSGEPMKVEGTYAFYEVDDAGKQKNKIDEGKFVAGKELSLDGISTWPSGRYRMMATVTDSLGREEKMEYTFLLFSQEDRQMPCEAELWHYEVESEFGPGRDGVLLFGSSLKDVYVLYDVVANNKRIAHERFLLTDSIVKKTFAYRPEYGDGLTVLVALVQNGELYQFKVQLINGYPEKKLDLKWTVFRDKLLPGQQEQWTLHVAHPDGRPAAAELLAVLYDRSLDKLMKHSWQLNLAFHRNLSYVNWQTNYGGDCHLSLDFPHRTWKVQGWIPDALIAYNWFGGIVTEVGFESEPLLFTTAGIRNKGMSRSLDATVGDLTENEVVADEFDEVSSVTLRSNFAETAFFYPQLQADEKGDIVFSFTLPESLTEWKFMGLVHTKDMDWGQLEASAVARKMFMLKPNMPRFLRRGDVTSIAATLSNLSGKGLNGEVRFELFNPATDEVYYIDKKEFRVADDKTTSLEFRFKVADDWSMLACRMIADAGDFSDGEQHYLPVLSDKEWIVESVPLVMTEKGRKEFDLGHLFNKGSKAAEERRLTVEFSSDPVWYAIQALPSLAEPISESVVDWVAVYYANNLAAFILQKCPRVKAMFDVWQAQGGGTKEKFMSELEKDSNLKAFVLEETPWIAEATDEAERRKRIALLFDLNMLKDKNRVAESKMRVLQLADGAWTWYKGMEGSRYMTQIVVEMLARLKRLTGCPLPDAVQDMYGKACSYLYKQAVKECEELNRLEKQGGGKVKPSELALHYLYLTALDPSLLVGESRKTIIGLLERVADLNNTYTIYGKACSAFVMQQYGYEKKATEFLQSLEEYAVKDADGCLYYDTRRVYYDWTAYRVPAQVAVIETMDEVAHDNEKVEKLKLWLLKQKRTQAWDSSLATVNAVYALLLRGVNSLENLGQVSISMDKYCWNTRSETENVNLLDGTFYKTLTGSDVPTILKEVVVEKEHDGLAWGAVYAQCLEKREAVEEQGGELVVKKMYFVERENEGRLQWMPLGEVDSLAVGEKVAVHLIVQLNQDMDFIQLKDDRAVCLEPAVQMSGYRWMDGIGTYVAVKDASTSYFFDRMPKGVYTLHTEYYVTRSGTYAGGLASVQSAYAPEYVAHTASRLLEVK